MKPATRGVADRILFHFSAGGGKRNEMKGAHDVVLCIQGGLNPSNPFIVMDVPRKEVEGHQIHIFTNNCEEEKFVLNG